MPKSWFKITILICSSNNMQPMLTMAVKAARRAGNIINRASLDMSKITVYTKGVGDYVTNVDQEAEAAIIEILQEAYPDHAFIGEETGASGQSDYRWIIDPLDGTKNFVHGFPNYAVSIALAHRGVITHAVIYDPSRNELFTASRGGGAFLNDRRIRVSSRKNLSDSLICLSHGFMSSTPERAKQAYELTHACNGTRRLGSTVLELAYVASGRLDAFCGRGLNAWDTAAGSLLVLEAGGLLGDLQGEQTWSKTGDVLASTPKLFPKLLAVLNPPH